MELSMKYTNQIEADLIHIRLLKRKPRLINNEITREIFNRAKENHINWVERSRKNKGE
jgi:hypothetical protein